MVSVDREKCIGCGACVSVCPEVFELYEGKSRVKEGKESSTLPCVKEAKDGCPVGAISI